METQVQKTNWKTSDTLGRWRFGRYKEHECTQLEESSTEERELEESEPESYTGCSA